MNFIPIINHSEYEEARKPSWPEYSDISNGKFPKDSGTQAEIVDFFAKGFQRYVSESRGDRVADDNRKMQSHEFFNRRVKLNKAVRKEHCRIPWNTMGINSYGDVYICQSPAWIPKFVGNVHQTNDIYDILNSKTARQIRQEILSGRYYYCNLKLCAFLRSPSMGSYLDTPLPSDDLQPMELQEFDDLLVSEIPTELIFDFDYTCNYKCPSCRTDLINNNKNPIIRPINDAISTKIKHMVIDEIKDQEVYIRWAGGEPFISQVYLDLMEYIVSTKKCNIKHVIHTNGSYLKSKGDLVKSLLPSIKELRISFDAATADTYHIVRVNGVWENLIDNVKWVVDAVNERQLPVKLTADFVVQKNNYKEIPMFGELCEELGIKHINFQKMWNWTTWPTEVFNEMNVWNHAHPDHDLVQKSIDETMQKLYHNNHDSIKR